jgi:NAD(P)-dependent dehydrogenase (short-subunit alcohol dehydrogenase family)
MACHFAHLGARVILCDTDAQQLAIAYDKCCEVSSNVEQKLIPDNSCETIDALFFSIQQEYGCFPDVLVNNWSALRLNPLANGTTCEAFISKYSQLASSLLMFGQVAANKMRERRSGVIVNIASQEPEYRNCDLENTSSLVTGFTKSWALELKPFNVRVGGVVPIRSDQFCSASHWNEIQQELIRNTEYIISNDYFSGRVVSTQL